MKKVIVPKITSQHQTDISVWSFFSDYINVAINVIFNDSSGYKLALTLNAGSLI